MATRVENWELKADPSDLVKGLGEAKQAFDGVNSKADDLGRKLKKTSSGSKDTGKKLEALKFAAQGAGGKVGEMAGRVESLSSAFMAAGPVAGAVTLAVAAAAATMVGGAVAAVKMGGAVVDLTNRAADLVDKAEDFQSIGGLGLDDEEINRIKRASQNMGELEKISGKFTVLVANELAPGVERVSTLVVALGLAALDSFDDMAKAAWTMVSAGLMPMGQELRNVAIVMKGFAEFAGIEVPSALEKAAEGTWQLDTALKVSDMALDRVERSLGDYIDAARSTIGTVSEATQVEQEHTEAVEVGTEAKKERTKAIEANMASLKKEIAAVQSIIAIRRTATADLRTQAEEAALTRDLQLEKLVELATEGTLAEEEAATARFEVWDRYHRDIAALEEDAAARHNQMLLDRVQQGTAAATQIMTATLDTIEAVSAARSSARIADLDAEIAAMETKGELNEQEKRQLQTLKNERHAAMVSAFRAEQFAAGAKILIDMAINMGRFATELGPIAGPLAATALAGAQIATVAAQQPPQKFHSGGIVQAPDEVSVTAQPGEGYLSKRATNRLGRTGVQSLNRGEFAGMGGNVSVYIGTNQIEPEIVDMARGDGDFGALVRDASPGMTARYGHG